MGWLWILGTISLIVVLFVVCLVTLGNTSAVGPAGQNGFSSFEVTLNGAPTTVANYSTPSVFYDPVYTTDGVFVSNTNPFIPVVVLNSTLVLLDVPLEGEGASFGSINVTGAIRALDLNTTGSMAAGGDVYVSGQLIVGGQLYNATQIATMITEVLLLRNEVATLSNQVTSLTNLVEQLS